MLCGNFLQNRYTCLSVAVQKCQSNNYECLKKLYEPAPVALIFFMLRPMKTAQQKVYCSIPVAQWLLHYFSGFFNPLFA